MFSRLSTAGYNDKTVTITDLDEVEDQVRQNEPPLVTFHNSSSLKEGKPLMIVVALCPRSLLYDSSPLMHNFVALERF